MSKRLLTERDILDLVKKGSTRLQVDENTIVTPAAKDAIAQYGVELVSAAGSQKQGGKSVTSVSVTNPTGKKQESEKTVAVGSDHGGFLLKEALKRFISELGYAVADVGTDSEDTCDYPDFAFAVATLVQTGQAERGIMIDGVGVASAIVANKVPGIRAVPCYDEFVARSSREHNNANVLTLGGRIVGTELAKSIVKIWLETPFAGGRHEGRVNKMGDVERRFSRKD